MALIDNVKRIAIEEFPDEDKETVERIANYYNYFAEQVTNAINGQLSIENLTREIIQLNVTVNSSGTPIVSTKFTTELGLLGVNVIRAQNLTNTTTYPASTPFLSFDSSGNGVYTIKNISGLQSNNKYKLTLELIYS